ncbi:MAG: glycosyltransferase family 4 protein [Acidobacteria bacterium]|nr:glycosyltransferase family 4 protein [Acidobacteriota bacterium]
MTAPRIIGFDATPLEVAYRSGVSRAVCELLRALAMRDDRWRYVALASRRLRTPLPSGVEGPYGPRLPNRFLWFQLALPRTIARLKPALCHFTNSVAPLADSTPYALTIHDVSLFLHPATQPRKSLFLVRTLMPVVARRARAVVAVSAAARRDIIEVLRVPGDRVHVVANGVAGEFHRMAQNALAETCRKYSLHRPFVLHVGNVEPRKNLERLIRAFMEVRRGGRVEELVLAGQLGWRYRSVLRLIEDERLGGAVRLIGYVPDSELPALYNLARVLAFPSLYEGFGLPILEAMACGTPVITSNRGAMAEQAGDAALLIDPLEVGEITAALERVLGDEALREQLCAAGIGRAAAFSWARSAADMVRIYERIGRSEF